MAIVQKIRSSTALTLSVLTFVIVAIFCGILLYWSFYPFKTIIDKQPSQVVNTEVEAGRSVIVIKDYCKYTSINATLIRNLINNTSIPLPEVKSTLPKGCHVTNVIIPIPDYVPTGKYYLKTTSIYKINPVRTISVDANTVEFNITGKD